MTTEDVQRVAGQYLDPAKLSIVVVGDRARLQPQLKALPLGEFEDLKK